MSVWAVVVLGVVGMWLAGAVFTAGLLWEREHLMGNADTRSPGWWFAYVVSSLAWVVLLPLWGNSRPAPSLAQPVEEDDGYLGAVSQGEYIPPRHYDFTDKELREMPQWQFLGLVEPGVTAVDNPHSLALCGRIQVGERVWVKSLGLVLTRREKLWFADCGCRYNVSGFPVVLCRTHQSDADPHGEPDEDEDSVGR